MASIPPLTIPVILLLVLTTVPAAVFDMRSRRIPNFLTLPAIFAGLAVNFYSGGKPALVQSLIGLAAGFGVYFVFYLIAGMGAGDVKLMAAVGSIAGIAAWLRIFIAVALLAAICGLAFALTRKRLRSTLWNVGFLLRQLLEDRAPRLPESAEKDPLRMPHGAIICAGTLLIAGLSLARFLAA